MYSSRRGFSRRGKTLTEEEREVYRENLKDLIAEHFGLDRTKSHNEEVVKRLFMYFFVKFSDVEDEVLLRMKLTEGHHFPTLKTYSERPSFFASLKRRCSVSRAAFSSLSLRRRATESTPSSGAASSSASASARPVSTLFNVSSQSQYEAQHSKLQLLAVGQTPTKKGLLAALEGNFAAGISSKQIKVPLALILEFGMLYQKLLRRCFDNSYTE